MTLSAKQRGDFAHAVEICRDVCLAMAVFWPKSIEITYWTPLQEVLLQGVSEEMTGI